MATRSMPMVPSLPMVRASSILVPTPSVPATSTGSLSFGSRSAPPKPPSPPSTNGCFVLLSRCFMRSTARLPASTSTPASLYVNPWSSAIVLPRRCDGASLRRTSPPPPALQSAARVSSRLAGRGASSAAHDGVVDHDEALAADHGAQRIELHADAHLAQLVVGLDEGAVHVAVLDEAFGVGDAGG